MSIYEVEKIPIRPICAEQQSAPDLPQGAKKAPCREAGGLFAKPAATRQRA